MRPLTARDVAQQNAACQAIGGCTSPNWSTSGHYAFNDRAQNTNATIGATNGTVTVTIRDEAAQAELEESGATTGVDEINSDLDTAQVVTRDEHERVNFYLSDSSLQAAANGLDRIGDAALAIEDRIGRALAPIEQLQLTGLHHAETSGLITDAELQACVSGQDCVVEVRIGTDSAYDPDAISPLQTFGEGTESENELPYDFDPALLVDPAYAIPDSLTELRPSWRDNSHTLASDFISRSFADGMFGSHGSMGLIDATPIAQFLDLDQNSISFAGSINEGSYFIAAGQLGLAAFDFLPMPAGRGVRGVVNSIDNVNLTRGTIGNWNRVANNPQSNTRYTFENGYTYRTDANGRVDDVSADLSLDPWNRNTYQQGVSGGNCREINDCGGHLIGSIFGGPGEGINIVPMNGVLNGSPRPGTGGGNTREWYNLERLWQTTLEAGGTVQVRIRPQYSGTSTRPTGFGVESTINGVRQPSRTIQNTPTGR